ncbi:acetolactate synthase, regulatory subunit, partial [Coemansia aciculifera]
MLGRHSAAAAALRAARASSSSSSTTPRMAAAHRHLSQKAGGWYDRRGTSTADAVSKIIYKTPTAQKTSHHIHVLNCFMQDEPGILTRATGIMAARGYNIDSVVVSRTEIPGLSRMTIT